MHHISRHDRSNRTKKTERKIAGYGTHPSVCNSQNPWLGEEERHATESPAVSLRRAASFRRGEREGFGEAAGGGRSEP
jgi:hypothetical protein